MKTKQTKHTPGPWFFDTTWALIKDARGEEIAAIHARVPGIHPAVAHKNAALIIAAPALLAIAEKRLMELGRAGGNMEGSPFRAEWLETRAAITKAEGAQ